MKKSLFWIMPVMVFGMVVAGCTSAPAVFESVGSLAGTQWEHRSTTRNSDGSVSKGGGSLVLNDAASGVYTDGNGRETRVTYTAVYNAEGRTFSGTITPEGGKEGVFNAKTGGIGGWSLTAAGLFDDLALAYVTPEILALRADADKKTAAFNEQYGEPYYLPPLSVNKGGVIVIYSLKRDSDGKKIPTSSYGDTSQFGFDFTPSYTLHSKDGATITMERNTVMNGPGTVVGTFKLSIRVKGTDDPLGSILTISDGTGEGAQFNGVWVVE